MKQLICQCKFDATTHSKFCPLVFFSTCSIVMPDMLIFLGNACVFSCSVLMFCERTFSFPFWIIKLEKSEQTVVSHVSIDLNKTAFLLIIWTLWKKFETPPELICLWLSILGSKAPGSFILATLRGILSTFFFFFWTIFSSEIS